MSKCKICRAKGVMILAALTVLVIAFIWGNSCVSGETSGAQSGVVTKLLQSILDPKGKIPEDSFHHFVRKTAHFTEFAVLGLLVGSLFWMIGRQTGRVFFSLPVLIVVLVAVMDEYIQYFSGRGSAVTDVVLDISGAVTGLTMVLLITVLMKKKK